MDRGRLTQIESCKQPEATVRTFLIVLGLLALAACWRLKQEDIMPSKIATTTPLPVLEKDPKKMTEAEWKARLTPEQFRVLRQNGTEPPGSGSLLHETRKGTYSCAACGNALFTSETKYDACGWPSFWDAIPGAVGLNGQWGAVEVVCARCDSHLGHLFNDGPPPTGKRY